MATDVNETGKGADQVDEQDLKAADQAAEIYGKLREELSRVIVGQDEVLKQVMIALFAQGHCLLEGVPGLAKTLMISSIAEMLSLKFSRVQFTPDLMPSDIVGTEILEEEEGTGRRQMKFVKGPIFGNIILGDEINRTPPKTQAALLQAMQEYEVTIAGQTFGLDRPFLVLGTQNPIEQEGTYPLPEAQLDRFMFRILVDYPTFEEELQIAEVTTSQEKVELNALLDAQEIMGLQQVVRKVIVSRSIAAYAVKLVRGTRPDTDDSPDFVKKYLTWGAGPRACQALLLGAKANALLEGRFNASIEDIKYVAFPVLRHRLVTSFSAESDGVTTDSIIRDLCEMTSEDL
ncbi:MAG: AAA family ATPase [Planctomycetaceae bacterium]|nr:AAA family ATPase [Planctomycetaceae bacterium]